MLSPPTSLFTTGTAMAGSWDPDFPQNPRGEAETAQNETSGAPPNPRASPSSHIPFIPTTATTSPENYGGLNPENEAVLDLIERVPDQSPRRFARLPQEENRPTGNYASSLEQGVFTPFRLIPSHPFRDHLTIATTIPCTSLLLSRRPAFSSFAHGLNVYLPPPLSAGF